MDLPTVLAAHLRDLVDSLGDEGTALSEVLMRLVADLRTAVPNYLGLRLTLVVDDWPVTFTAFVAVDGMRPATSLRLNLSGLGDDLHPDSQIVFYAATPGAFVDLAADVAYVHRGGRLPGSGRDGVADQSAMHDGHGPAVALDLDLPPITLVSGFTGLAEYSTMNRAIGVLIERGHDADGARAALHRGAAADGLPVHQYAARLLQP